MASLRHRSSNLSSTLSNRSFQSLPTRIDDDRQYQRHVTMAERRYGGHFELVQNQDLFTYRYAANDPRHSTVPGFTWRQTEHEHPHSLLPGLSSSSDGLVSTHDNFPGMWESGSDCDSNKENKDPERRSQDMISFGVQSSDGDSNKENEDPEQRGCKENGFNRGEGSQLTQLGGRESSTKPAASIRVYEDSKRRRLLEAWSERSQVRGGISSIKQLGSKLAAKTKVSQAIRTVSDSEITRKMSNLFSGLSLSRNGAQKKESRRAVSAPAELFPHVAKRVERNEINTADHSRVLGGRRGARASGSRKPLREIQGATVA